VLDIESHPQNGRNIS